MFSADKNSLKILFVASEAAPFAKAGGLGEVMRSLPEALRRIGHDARVFTPKYATIDTAEYPLKIVTANLPLINKEQDPYGLIISNILAYSDKNGSITNYFLENMEYYEKRANVYGYTDDTTRWLLLSRGVLEFVRQSDWKPDVIVASDWQTGFIPNMIEVELKDDPTLSRIATVYSIHNLKYQGLFNPNFVSEIDYDSGQGPLPDYFDPNVTKLNGARRGLLYADVINTVSPTYAKEILLPEYGEKLNEVLKERKERLFGILNGIDYDTFNPETDPALAENYSFKKLKHRAKNKPVLQQKMGLPVVDKFLLGFVGRLDSQKGIDLPLQTADSLFDNLDMQLVLLGEGDNQYKLALQELQQKYPDKEAVNLSFGAMETPRTIYAGADAVIVPSLFEPSGLVQMEAMRYGSIPIVRRVGGLADSVSDYTPGEGKGTGFVFGKFDANAFLIAVVRAYETFRNKNEWEKLIGRAMAEDFSWSKSAQEYINLFKTAMGLHNKHQ